MLNNITNFFNLIKTGKVKTQLDASDLLPIGTRDLRFIGQYQPTMIKYSDLASQILAGPLTVGVTSIASGTVNRVLFEGTNNKLSESANLTWDNANQNFRVVGNLFAGLNNYCSLSNALSGYGAVGSNYYYEGNIAKRTNPDLASQLDFSNGFKFKNAGGGLAGSTITWSDLGYWNGATGNLLVGTTTDAGFRLDVNGTARVSGNFNIATGFELNFNNANVGLYRSANSLRLGGFGGIEFLSSPTTIASQTVRMVLFDTGNLCIGNTLDVASARLIVNSTTQGFLPPRMTAAQRTAIASPAVGLMVYQTDGTEGLYIFRSTGWALNS